jgi:hypothetical protein
MHNVSKFQRTTVALNCMPAAHDHTNLECVTVTTVDEVSCGRQGFEYGQCISANLPTQHTMWWQLQRVLGHSVLLPAAEPLERVVQQNHASDRSIDVVQCLDLL